MKRKITNPEEYDAYYDLMVNNMEFVLRDRNDENLYYYDLVCGNHLVYNNYTRELFIEEYE